MVNVFLLLRDGQATLDGEVIALDRKKVSRFQSLACFRRPRAAFENSSARLSCAMRRSWLTLCGESESNTRPRAMKAEACGAPKHVFQNNAARFERAQTALMR